MDLADALQPVRIIGHHPGLSFGFYGASHHATEDIGVLRSITKMTIIPPADGKQKYAAMMASKDYDGPIYYRTGPGRAPEVSAEGAAFVIGKAIEHLKGEAVTITACGIPLPPSIQAAKKLNAEGHPVGVVDMHMIKEHNVLGSAIAVVLAENPGKARLVCHGINGEYPQIGPPTHLHRHDKLDEAGIEDVVRGALR